MFKIMIVEDDIKIRTLMTDILRKYSYEVVEVADFLQVEKIFEQEAPQLVLLDLNCLIMTGSTIAGYSEGKLRCRLL